MIGVGKAAGTGPKILAILASPRIKGNSEGLLDAFVEELAETVPGADIEKVKLGMGIRPCLGCDKCISGSCVQKDAMMEMYPKLKSADVIVLSSPVYFYGFPSHAKAMMDRCQLFYNLKYRRKLKWREKPGLGVLLACGASHGDSLFSGMSATARYWFDALDFEFRGKVDVRGVDEPGDIHHFPATLEKARKLAKKTAASLGYQS